MVLTYRQKAFYLLGWIIELGFDANAPGYLFGILSDHAVLAATMNRTLAVSRDVLYVQTPTVMDGTDSKEDLVELLFNEWIWNLTCDH